MQKSMLMTFDAVRNCVVPDAENESVAPLEGLSLLTAAEQLNDQGQTQLSIQAMLTPARVPAADLSAFRTAQQPETIVMGCPPGYTRMGYDFESPVHRRVFRSNLHYTLAWETLRQAFESLGAHVVALPDNALRFSNGRLNPFGFMQFYPRDAGFMWNDVFYAPSNKAQFDSYLLLHTGRPGGDSEKDLELVAAKSILLAQSKDVLCADVAQGLGDVPCKKVEAFFEGGDILADEKRGLLFVGHDKRQGDSKVGKLEAAAREHLGRETGARVINIHRCAFDARPDGGVDVGNWHHLDTFMAPLPNGGMLCDPRRTDKASLRQLDHIYGSKLVLIDPETPNVVKTPLDELVANLAGNLVCIGHSLVMPYCTPVTQKRLEKQGLTVVRPEDMKVTAGFLHMSQGGPHCITASRWPRPTV